MTTGLLQKHRWYEAGEAAKEELSQRLQRSDFEARWFRSSIDAVFELVWGAATFLAHKRTVVLVQGNNWHDQAILPLLLREGLNVRTVLAKDLHSPEDFIQGLGGDCSCVFWAVDHPVLDDLCRLDQLDQSLNKNRILSIRLSHHLWCKSIQAPNPYSAHVLALGEGSCLALLGARVKLPPLLASYQHQGQPPVVDCSLKTDIQERRALVEKFEDHLKDEYNIFSYGEERAYLRSCFFSREHSGDEVLSSLVADPRLVTTHLCRWGLAKSELSWWQPLPSDEVLRGLICLDFELLNEPWIQSAFVKE